MYFTSRSGSAGFTLLELLGVLAILAVLLTIGSSALLQLRNTQLAETYVQTLVQDINLARSRTAATGAPHRVTLHPDTYRIERQDPTGLWRPLREQRSERVRISGMRPGDTVLMTSRGAARFLSAAGAPLARPVDTLLATYGNTTRTIRITLTGVAHAL